MKTLLFFSASWCGACKVLKPIVEQEAPQKGYKIDYIDVETDKGADDADVYNIRSLPTIVVLDEQGAEIRRASGNTAWKELQK